MLHKPGDPPVTAVDGLINFEVCCFSSLPLFYAFVSIRRASALPSGQHGRHRRGRPLCWDQVAHVLLEALARRRSHPGRHATADARTCLSAGCSTCTDALTVNRTHTRPSGRGNGFYWRSGLLRQEQTRGNITIKVLIKQRINVAMGCSDSTCPSPSPHQPGRRCDWTLTDSTPVLLCPGVPVVPALHDLRDAAEKEGHFNDLHGLGNASIRN